MYSKKSKPLGRHLSNFLIHSSVQIKFLLLIILFLVLFVLINFSGSPTQINEQIISQNNPDNSFILNALIEPGDDDDKPVYNLVYPYGENGIFIYNMSEPIESWWPFDCYKTKMKYSINTKLCIYDPKFDKHISEQIKTNGLWEPTNVRSFMRLLNEVKDANVIDLGANIGLYSLLAAKLNRSVISIEPVHENLNRIHKAALLEEVHSNIIGLVNAVSNHRKQLKINIVDNNMGGSYVKDDDSVNYEQSSSSSVIVNSIILDDVLQVVRDKIGVKSKKFVLKIDIESHEPYVFQNCTNLFRELKVIAVFMEFGKSVERLTILEKLEDKTKYREYLKLMQAMVNRMKDMNYEPYEMNGINKLDYDKWKADWPWDVYFRQCDFIHCPDHTYKLSGF